MVARGPGRATQEDLYCEMLREATTTYNPVVESGLGALYCLGSEVYCKVSKFTAGGRQCIELLPKLARERARGAHPRLRKGMALAYQRRWSDLIAIGLQKAVADATLRRQEAELVTTLLEPV